MAQPQVENNPAFLESLVSKEGSNTFAQNLRVNIQ